MLLVIIPFCELLDLSNHLPKRMRCSGIHSGADNFTPRAGKFGYLYENCELNVYGQFDFLLVSVEVLSII